MGAMIGLLLVAFLVLMNAFFVAGEFAVVASRTSRLKEWHREGRAGLRAAIWATQQRDRMVAASQLGITIASIGLGFAGKPALAHLIEPWLEALPQFVSSITVTGLSVGIAFSIITFLHVVVGELAPKALALQYPEQTMVGVSRAFVAFEFLFRPVIWLLNESGFLLLRLLRLPRPSERERVHSVEELRMLVTESEEGGELEEHEEDMIHKVFAFADREIREVMIPRTDVIGLPADGTVRDLLQVFAQHPHARFPVYEESLDQVVGIVAIKEVLRALATSADGYQRPLRELAREPIFVPESGQVGQLFEDLRRRGTQMAIAVDEYGGMAGLVTLEEMVEEIVGRIGDELAGHEPPLEHIDELTVQIDGQMRIDELNHELGLNVPEAQDYETVAGFLLDLIGRLPKQDEEILWDGIRFKVVEMKGPRIEEVQVTLKERRRPGEGELEPSPD